MSDDYIAIGDIHGRFDLLLKFLEKCRHRMDTHKLVFLGDMVDRGPQSFEVVDAIRNLCEAGKAIALLGNHDDMMLDYYRERIFKKHSLWSMNGGDHTMRSYCNQMKLFGNGHFFEAFGKSGHSAWLKSLPYFHETNKVWFSHAPIPSRQIVINGLTNFPTFEGDFRANKYALTWTYVSRSMEGEWERDHEKTAVCGHIHALREGVLEPRIYPQIIYADTGAGCAPEGRLSGIIITDGKYEGFFQIDPLKS